MTRDATRLPFLLETVVLEWRHLSSTDERLFRQPFSMQRAAALRDDVDDAERTDAFVVRFGRLQDTLLGDKLLPELLRWLAEPVGPVIDNLDRAERLGLLASVDDWLAARQLRDRMVPEHVRDAAALAGALNEGHAAVPMLRDAVAAVAAFCAARGLSVVP